MLDVRFTLHQRTGLLRVYVQTNGLETLFDKGQEERKADISQPHDSDNSFLPFDFFNEFFFHDPYMIVIDGSTL